MILNDSYFDKVRGVSRQYHARRVYLFGSMIGNPASARDIDIGVEGLPPEHFFKFMGELIDIFPVQVDLVDLDADNSFSRLIKKHGRILYDTTA